jgi:hypothetical protein
MADKRVLHEYEAPAARRFSRDPGSEKRGAGVFPFTAINVGCGSSIVVSLAQLLQRLVASVLDADLKIFI